MQTPLHKYILSASFYISWMKFYDKNEIRCKPHSTVEKWQFCKSWHPVFHFSRFPQAFLLWGPHLSFWLPPHRKFAIIVPYSQNVWRLKQIFLFIANWDSKNACTKLATEVIIFSCPSLLLLSLLYYPCAIISHSLKPQKNLPFSETKWHLNYCLQR